MRRILAVAVALGGAGCRAAAWQATEDPSVSDAVVLLAQISPTAVTVEGVLDGVTQHVDVGGGDDDRQGFRYRLVDEGGDTIFERSTLGPVLVESFLEYWSGVSGVDILASLPTLGRFPLHVPLIAEARTVEFDVRGDDGEYALRGSWDLGLLDRQIVPSDPTLSTQTETMHDPGASRNRLDIVIVSDGYRSSEMPLFREHSATVAERLLAAEPFTTYADRIRIVRVEVPSKDSGASYECETCGAVENVFGSIFAIELVNRISGGAYSSRAIFQADQWAVASAIAHVEWDQVIVLVNSPQFGGMAVHYATATTGPSDYGTTAVHEFGHAFGLLGDEYVFDDCIRGGSVGLPENITDRPRNPPWAHWVDGDTPLPTPAGEGYGIGAYEGAWNCADLHRPAEDCKMNTGGAFCDVCREALVRRLFRYGDPARYVTVADDRVVAVDASPDARIVVTLDGEAVGEGTAASPPELPRSSGLLEVEVTEISEYVRSDPYGDLSQIYAFESLR